MPENRCFCLAESISDAGDLTPPEGITTLAFGPDTYHSQGWPGAWDAFWER